MFGSIDRQVLVEAVNKTGNGRICRIGYRTELPVKAEYKKQGMSITKFTERSVRIGVKYSNIESVKQRLVDRIKATVVKTDNYLWRIPNKIKYNTKTEKTYLQVATLNKHHHTHKKYLIIWPDKGIYVFTDDIEDSPYKNCIINSYFTKKDNSNYGSEIQNIVINNIYKFNKIEA